MRMETLTLIYIGLAREFLHKDIISSHGLRLFNNRWRIYEKFPNNTNGIKL